MQTRLRYVKDAFWCLTIHHNNPAHARLIMSNVLLLVYIYTFIKTDNGELEIQLLFFYAHPNHVTSVYNTKYDSIR